MYILAIVGSQRKRGNTARLVQMIGAELGELAGRAGQPLSEVLLMGDRASWFRGVKQLFTAACVLTSERSGHR